MAPNSEESKRYPSRHQRCPFAIKGTSWTADHNQHIWHPNGKWIAGKFTGARRCVGYGPNRHAPRRKPHRNIRTDFIEKLRYVWRPGMKRRDCAEAMGIKFRTFDKMLSRCRADGDLPPVDFRCGNEFNPFGLLTPAPHWVSSTESYRLARARRSKTAMDYDSSGGRH